MEARIPLAVLGPSYSGAGDSNLWIHWAMKCGSDYLNLQGDVNAAPEPATFFLLGGGILGVMGFGRNKKF